MIFGSDTSCFSDFDVVTRFMPILVHCGRFEVHFDGFSVFLDHSEHPKQHEILLMPFRSPGVEESDSYIFDPFLAFFPPFFEQFFFLAIFLSNFSKN